MSQMHSEFNRGLKAIARKLEIPWNKAFYIYFVCRIETKQTTPAKIYLNEKKKPIIVLHHHRLDNINIVCVCFSFFVVSKNI
jgi:hypothetical protein